MGRNLRLKVCFEPVVKGDPTLNYTTSTKFQARFKADIFDDTAGSNVQDSWSGLVGAMPGASIIKFYAGFTEGYPDHYDPVDMSSQPVDETPLPKASDGGATL